MASRFGAASTSRSRNAKLKILIACMVLLLLVLLATLGYVIQSTRAVEGTMPATVDTAQSNLNNNTVGILIPAFRIEEGSKLSPNMFTTEYVPNEQIPLGAVTADKLPALETKFAKRLINPNVTLVQDDISDSPPLSTIDIPPGYRLITIEVNNRSGVEGWAKPGTRVDVLWTFEKDGKQRIASIAKFVKVISVAGNIQNSPDAPQAVAAKDPITVSLLVTEQHAQYIELARSNGNLSLALVGQTEIPNEGGVKTAIVTLDDIIGDPKPTDKVEEVPPDGVLYVDDPVTGKQKKYVLRNGRWALDKSYSD
jgi:pilus assembly protein CpaB